MGKFVNHIGKRFGRLVVMMRTPNHGKYIAWLCQCDCGVARIVCSQALTSKNTRSCGCLWKESLKKNSEKAKKHGMSNTPEFRAWYHLKRRCLDPRDIGFPSYGGRGIKVCKRWENSFDLFYKDMGPRPDGMSIERINVNGNYEPSNCKWIPLIDQAKNKRAGKNSHCPRGHLYDEKNTRIQKRTKVCRICRKNQSKVFYKKKKTRVVKGDQNGIQF